MVKEGTGICVKLCIILLLFLRLIPRPVWKPTTWFPPNPSPPWWTVQVNINVLYWVLIVASFIVRFWRIDYPKYVV